MQDIPKWALTIGLLLVLVSTPSLTNSDFNLSNYSENESNNIVLNGISYTPHAPIIISSNTDFISLGFNGSGTLGDPYLIEGLNITSSIAHLISISDTTVYFTIENNFLKSNNSPDYIGIVLLNAPNGEIKSNVIQNVDQGISLAGSNNIKIENNTIGNVNAAGIEVFADSTTVVNNTLFNNAQGITLEGINHLIESNTIYGNSGFDSGDGIFSGGLFSDSSIINNKIFDNDGQGIFILESDNLDISNNTIYNNANGMNLFNNQNVTISYNELHSNVEFGIFISGGNQDFIIKNNIVRDNIGPGIQLLDFDNIIFNNNITMSSNLLSNNREGIWISPGNNNNFVFENDLKDNQQGNVRDDGANNFINNNYYTDWMGSGTYIIDGSANNQDFSPSSSPNHMSELNLVVEDLGNSTLSGNVSISWNEVNDRFGDSLSYSILYSSNEGMVWNLIQSNILSFNYQFDSLIIADGFEVLFKIDAIDEFGFTSSGISEKTYLIANSLHKLSTPILSAPTGSILNNLVTIEWSHSIDTWSGHTVTYSVHYFAKGGSTWIELASNLTNNFYVWDTKTIVDGSYLLKVVSTDSEGNTAENVSVMLFEVVNNITTIIDPVSSSAFDPTNSSRTENATLPWSNIQIIILSLSVIIMFYRKKRI